MTKIANGSSSLKRFPNKANTKRLYTEVLDVQRVILDPNHPDTSVTQNNMAVVLQNLGEREEAAEF
ncbi:tetratricopeptide repeat protein [Wolbachia pipientis]|uniref:tetratricopeptide repeat protein n=1 Tax=Wolbachia pipientis TaxID=955 RepID=UPI00202F32C3|nr:tetratricopeptide repeat protein [Wolbachia pipientis]MCM1001858.1 tetratricopeptide repeat protein [Wolbachia pipientis]